MLVWAFRYLGIVVLAAGAFAVLEVDLPDPRADAGLVRVAVRPATSPVLETLLPAGPNGHYWVEAMVEGVPLSFIVDTGASDVILSPGDAGRLGIRPETLRFERRYRTANGEIRGAPVRLRELRIEQQSLYDLEAVVVDAPLDVSLLGMDFLRRLDGYEVRNGHLVLRW